MGSFSLIDNSFDPHLTTSYYLSIRLTPDGLTVCTLDPIQNKYIQISHIVLNDEAELQTQIENQFVTLDYLNFPYKKTFILFPSQTATLIPSVIFDVEKAGNILNFCCNVSDKETIHCNKIKMLDIYNVFAIPSEIETTIKKQFSSPNFVHQYTPVIESFLSSMASINETNYMCVNFNRGFIDIVVFEKEKLKSCASFPIQSENDFIYFTLLIFDKHNLDKFTTTILISGTDEENRKYIQKLTNYINKVEIIDFPVDFRCEIMLKEPKTKGFYDLLYLPLCV